MTYATRFIGKRVVVTIDRPLGSRHPKYGFEYLVNYGFIEGTLAPDGKEVDAYILGVTAPIENFTGTRIAVIHRTDDDDDKLVVVPEGAVFSDDEIIALTEFQEKFFKSVIIRT